mmetsp:Transcript_51769/g.161094  ORF Transcript_51769/g.161094 Transcript_51769/m.161094 type:complete len:319 (-) Transcript_51769:14-970(-)
MEDGKHVDVGRNLCGLGLGKRGQTVHESYEDRLDVDPGLKLRAGSQELLEGAKVELVGENLDDHFHEVLLGNLVLAADDLLQDTGENLCLVHVCIDPLKVREPDQVRAHEDAQVESLSLPPLSVAHGPLMLHADPQLVHLREVVHEEVDAVCHVTAVLRADVRQLVPSALKQVVPQEQPSHRVLDSSAHLHQILEDVSCRGLLGPDVHASNCDEKKQPRDYVPSMLHQLVQLDHSPPSLPLLQEVLLQMSHLIRNHDVKFVKILGREKTGSELAQHIASVLETVTQVGVVESSLHQEGLLLHNSLALLQPSCLLLFRR